MTVAQYKERLDTLEAAPAAAAGGASPTRVVHLPP